VEPFFPPRLHSWVEDGQFTKLVEQVYTKNDPDPKALACFGLLVRWQNDKEQAKRKFGYALWKEIHVQTRPSNTYTGHAQRCINQENVCC